MTDKPDFLRAKEKISDALSWRGDVNVNLGGETVTFKHRLLNETELLEVKRSLNMSELDEADNAGQTDAQERLLELQQKEDLSDAEEAELEDLSGQVAQQTDQIERALGEDGYDILMEMGRRTIEPSDDYVDYVYELPPQDMKSELGMQTLPNPVTKGAVSERLSEQMVDVIDEQPYPIKLNIGMQAFSETLSVLGNGSQR